MVHKYLLWDLGSLRNSFYETSIQDFNLLDICRSEFEIQHCILHILHPKFGFMSFDFYSGHS